MIRVLRLLAIAVAAGVAAPASACAPVTIYFEWNSARIEQASTAALERLAIRLAWRQPDLDAVILTSHTDASGSAAGNRALARRRAEAVRAVLVANEVPARLIETRLFAAGRPRVLTPAAAREPENRRVELLLQFSARAQAAQLEDGAPIC